MSNSDYRKSKAVTKIDKKIENIDPASFRYKILIMARQFKTNWIQLGQYLYTVYNDKKYKEWGFLSFEGYCANEIGIKKTTATKLLNSYYFLEKEIPSFLKAGQHNELDVHKLPSFDAIDLLRRAKSDKDIKEDDYDILRKNVFENAKEPKDIKRELKVLKYQLKAPDELIQEQSTTNLRRLVTTLKNIKRNLEMTKMLPKSVVSEIDKLVEKIENYM